MTAEYMDMHTVAYSTLLNEYNEIEDEIEDSNSFPLRIDRLFDQDLGQISEGNEPSTPIFGQNNQQTLSFNGDEELSSQNFPQVVQNRSQGNGNIISLVPNQNLFHVEEYHQTTTQSRTKSKHYDNKRAECVTLEMNKFLQISNKVFCGTGKNLVPSNTGIQFRGSVDTHKCFMNAKIYQILCYQKEDNKNVIINLLYDKKNELLGSIVNYSFKQIHEIYTDIQSSESLELDEKKERIKKFLASNDFYYEKCIEEKIEKMREQNRKTEEDIINKKNDLLKYTKNLIDDIEGKGELIKRDKGNRIRNKEIIYAFINEIEKYA